MRRAFRAQLPIAVERALHSYHEVAKAQGEDGLDWAVIVGPASAVLEAVARDGARRALLSVGIADDDSIVDQTFEEAVAAAKDRAAEMVGMRYNARGDLAPNPNAEWRIDETTRDKIRAAVSDAINEGLPADELADRIEETGAFSDARAEMIARTEIIRANNLGHMAAYHNAGIEQKAWSTAQDETTCPICTGNQDQGAIPIDDEFESGDQAAPAHPNCRCVIVPIVPDATDDDE